MLATELANLCTAETLRTGEGEYELDQRISSAYDVLSSLQTFGFPAALEKHRWEVIEKVPETLRKRLASAMASVWRRRDPLGSMMDGYESEQYTSGNPAEIHAALSEYLQLRWLRHPSVDWIFLDIMITRELSALGEEIKKRYFPGKKDDMGVHHKYWTAKGKASEMSTLTGLAKLMGPSKEFANPNSPFSKAMNLWDSMYNTWRCLAGPVINPTVVRDEMLKSTSEGAVWDVPARALIERVIEFDRAVWLVGPYSK